MSKCSFMRIAKEAGAVYKVGKMSLVNTELLDAYLENFRVEIYEIRYLKP